MKKLIKILALVAAGAFAFGGMLTSCSSGGDDPVAPQKPQSKPVAPSYSIDFEEDVSELLTVNVGEDLVLNIKSESGDYVVDTDNLPEEITVTKADGKLTIHGKKETSANVSFLLYPLKAGDSTDFDKEIWVKVFEPIFELTLNLDDALAAKAAKIVVKYGNEQDNKFEEVEAVYTATEQTAVALLKKELANSDTWFNKTVVTVYDASDNVVSSELNVAYFCYTDADFTGLSLTAALEEKTFTLWFDGFEIPAGKVEGVLVSNKWNTWEGDDVVFAPAVTVAEDGKSASFAIPLEKLTESADFYVKAADIVIKNSSDEVQEISALSSSDSNYWYAYADETKMWITLAYVALTDADYTATAAVTGSIVITNPAVLVEASALTDAKAIKVVYTEGADDIVGGETWITLYSSASWGNETKLVNAWDSTVSVYDETAKTYTLYITAKDVVNAFAANGIYVCADSSAYTGTITVSFVPGTSE